MLKWSCKVSDIKEFGTPYMLEAQPDVPDAFILRIHGPMPGSIPAPDSKGGHFIAFGNACTLMGCLLVTNGDMGQSKINYNQGLIDSEQRLVCGPCPCHGTSFDLTMQGLVILGPATQNLPQLNLKVKDDFKNSFSISATRASFQSFWE